MDADLLRLILLLVGVLVVVAIYFWDHAKRKKRRALSREPTEIAEHGQVLIPTDTDQADGGISTLQPEPAHMDQELDRLGELLAGEHGTPPAATAMDNRQEPFSHPEPQPRPDTQSQPRMAEDIPTKIIQINVASKRGGFNGKAIEKAVKAAGLVAGEMSIFHRFANRTGNPVLFSVASMVEPGTFPLDDMADFSTPGLTLFAKLPAPMEGLALFSDMVHAAQQLAAALDGELQDETHSALTRQTIEHKREEILEYRRQIELSRRKT